MSPLKKFPFLLLLMFSTLVHAQEQSSWGTSINASDANFHETEEKFNAYWQDVIPGRGEGWKPYKRWQNMRAPRTYPSGKIPGKVNVLDEIRPFGLLNKQKKKSASTGWTSLGPVSFSDETNPANLGYGRVNVIAEDPIDTNIIYIGAAAGGVWKTVNGGESWIPLTDHFVAIGISGIVVDYTDNQVVYAATGDRDGDDTYSIGVMKSTDGGATWQPTGMQHNVTDNITCSVIMMHPNDHNTLFVGTNEGFYKSTDAGDTWTKTAIYNALTMAFKPGNPDVIYISGKSVARSTDGGDSFLPLTSGLPSSFDVERYCVAVSEADPEYVYALASNDINFGLLGVYQSTNGGDTWSTKFTSPNILGWEADGSSIRGQGWYDLALSASPLDAEEIYVGGINVWKSLDGGSSFELSGFWYNIDSADFVHADQHFLMQIRNKVYLGNDGGIFTSYDGETWKDISHGLEISQFYGIGDSPQNTSLIMAGAQDNGTSFFDGSEWQYWSGGDGMDTYIDYADLSTSYIAGYDGYIARYDNFGADRSTISSTENEQAAWVIPYTINPRDNQVLFAGYRNVWKSTNRGDTWTKLTDLTGGPLNEIHVAENDDQYVFASKNSQLHRTTDGGITWSIISDSLPNLAITGICTDPLNEQLVYVCYSGYEDGEKIYKSEDGGDTWTNLTMNLPNLPSNTCIVQKAGNSGIYIGMDVGVYYYDETLGEWIAYADDLPNVIIYELEINYGNSKLRAATYGRGVWETDLYVPSVLLPIANFGFNQQVICDSFDIQFYNRSVFDSAGIEWLGPYISGTNDSTSYTLPMNDSIAVTMVAHNLNGTDTITKYVDVAYGPNPVTLFLKSDNYPEESSWFLTDEHGATLESVDDMTLQGNTYIYNFCLADGCYYFQIDDEYGDGLCCNAGNGYYTLIDGNSGAVISTGNEFGSMDSVSFCVEDTNWVAPNAIPSLGGSPIHIHPNPFHATLTIDGPPAAELRLIDVLGRFILSAKNTNQLSGLDALRSGTYFLQVTDTKGRRSTTRIVKE